MFILKVVVEHPIHKLDNYFYYASKSDLEVGTRVKINFNNQKIIGFVIEKLEREGSIEEISEDLGFDLKFIDEVVDKTPIINKELFNLSFELSKKYFYPLIGVLQTMLPPSLKPLGNVDNKPQIAYEYFYEYFPNDSLKYTTYEKRIIDKFSKVYKIPKNDINKSKALESLIEKGVIVLKQYEKHRYKIEKIFDYHDSFKLNEEQNKLYNEYLRSDDLIYLLHGVTGSGKTEFYIKCIEQELNKGRQALILVPEIALTPLMISRISSYFKNETIAVLHSSLTPSEKYDEYRKIKDNLAQIVIGTRSAIFAPLNNIGIICIDEEHSSSYKEEERLPYHAIDVAQIRAKTHNAKIILGSATPSIESMAKAKTGKYHLLTLSTRFNNQDLPQIEVVDLTNYNNFSYKSSIFSLSLIKEIKDRISKNEQVILFVNNRGYANSVVCRECGTTFKCPHCNLNLIYHKEDNTLRCHHCDYSIKKPATCPTCNSKYLMYTGFGIEKVEEDFKKIFNVPYLVLDSDRAQKTLQISTILSKFNKNEVPVLIGTQMVSKGHDFDNVTLIGVLNADSLLSYPSCRALENTFNLLTQTIGRAGRKDKKGLAIIQTSFKDNFAISCALKNDYDSFYNEELKARKVLKNPPFYNIVAIKLISKNKNNLEIYAKDIFNYLNYQNENLIINNFTLAIKKGPYFEKTIYVKYKKISDVHDKIKQIINIFKEKSELKIKINLNPYEY